MGRDGQSHEKKTQGFFQDGEARGAAEEHLELRHEVGVRRMRRIIWVINSEGTIEKRVRLDFWNEIKWKQNDMRVGGCVGVC